MATTFGAKSSPKHVPAIIAAVLTIAFLILGFKRLDLTGTDFLTRVEFLWMDYKFKIRGPQTSGNEVLLVGLDGKTLNRYGSGRLFQRDIFANLVDRRA
jgi:CHASE2 domain-containing sensor protein